MLEITQEHKDTFSAQRTSSAATLAGESVVELIWREWWWGWARCIATHPTHTTHYTQHTIHYTLHTTHYTQYTTHYTLHTTHNTLHTTNYTLHTIHYTLHTTHNTLHTTHYTPHTIHNTLHTTHFTLHTIHYTLHTSCSECYHPSPGGVSEHDCYEEGCVSVCVRGGGGGGGVSVCVCGERRVYGGREVSQYSLTHKHTLHTFRETARIGWQSTNTAHRTLGQTSQNPRRESILHGIHAGYLSHSHAVYLVVVVHNKYHIHTRMCSQRRLSTNTKERKRSLLRRCKL